MTNLAPTVMKIGEYELEVQQIRAKEKLLSNGTAEFTGAISTSGSVTSSDRITGESLASYAPLDNAQWLVYNDDAISASERWNIILTGAESGANAGSNLRFNRYDDTGAFLGIGMTLNRDNGDASVTNDFTVGNDIIATNDCVVNNDLAVVNDMNMGVGYIDSLTKTLGSGGIYDNTSTALAIADSTNYYFVKLSALTDAEGNSSDFTTDLTNASIQVGTAGLYEITYTVSFTKAAGTSSVIESGVFVNVADTTKSTGTTGRNTQSYQQISSGAAGNYVTITGQCMESASANDYFKVGLREIGATDNLTIASMTFQVKAVRV